MLSTEAFVLLRLMQRWYVSAYNSPHAGSIHFSSGLYNRWKLTILSLVNYQDYIGILFENCTDLPYEEIVLVFEKKSLQI
jgi:hypothetical protein